MPRPAPVDLQTHRVLAGPSRVRVLEFLRAQDGGRSAPEVAEQVGLHANTVRLHLDQLAAAGLVARVQEPRRGPGRPRLLYSAAPAVTTPVEDADGFRMLAGVLAAQLERISGEPGGVAAEAGRAWAHSRTDRVGPPMPTTPEEAVLRLIDALDELGFDPMAPEVADGPVELLRCPFGQVAEQHTEVVCGVHLGLMQGLLDDLAAPVHVTRLEPFVAPGVCRAHLTLLPADAIRSESAPSEATPSDSTPSDSTPSDSTAPPTEGLFR